MSKKNKKFQEYSGNFSIGDKVCVTIGTKEVKRGIIVNQNDTHVQILDPVEYKVKDANVCISDYHDSNIEWFSKSAPLASRREGTRVHQGMFVRPFPKMDLTRRFSTVRLYEVSDTSNFKQDKKRK